MQHFFVTPGQVKKPYIYLEGSDVNHMKNVLRMKTGEQLGVSDGDNHRYICQVERFEDETAVVRIVREEENDTELDTKFYLFQGLPKGDKMELIIQKAVELGVYEVIPVATKRSVVKLDAKKAAKKVSRWNEIARSAAKQAGRGIVPQVREVMDYKEALVYAKELHTVLLPYELAEGMQGTKDIISRLQSGQSVGIFIGPEGGFEIGEVEAAKEIGAKEITLGKRILRTETAGLAVLAILMYHLES